MTIYHCNFVLIVSHILLDNNERPTFYMNCNHNEKYGMALYLKVEKRDSFHILLFIICLFCCTPIKYSQFYFTPVFHSAP